MPTIEIYTTKLCPYCVRAKHILSRNGHTFAEFAVDRDLELRRTMIRRSGRTSVPQIFIDGTHVGGCRELQQLEASGGLSALSGGD